MWLCTGVRGSELVQAGRLPPGSTVKGSMSLIGSDVSSLPEGLTVTGSLDLHRCTMLTHLPQGLKVGWDLRISGCTSLIAAYAAGVDGEVFTDWEFVERIPKGDLFLYTHFRWYGDIIQGLYFSRLSGM